MNKWLIIRITIYTILFIYILFGSIYLNDTGITPTNYLNHDPEISLLVHIILLFVFQIIPSLIIPTFLIRMILNIQKENSYLPKPWILPTSKINPFNFMNPIVMLHFIISCLMIIGISLLILQGIKGIIGSGFMLLVISIGFFIGIQNFIKRNPNLFISEKIK